MVIARKKLTKAQAQLWLSEAWGRSIRISSIRLRGDWLFVRDMDAFPDYPDEVDCIHMPLGYRFRGDIYAEPYDTIRLEDSPFVPNNKEAVGIAIAKLDTAVAKYYVDMMEKESGSS